MSEEKKPTQAEIISNKLDSVIERLNAIETAHKREPKKDDHSNLPKHYNYCSDCGTEIKKDEEENVYTCSECDSRVGETEKYCWSCGKEL